MIEGITRLQLAALFLAGGLGGFLNAVAGGASLVVFPILVLIGLAPKEANATNNLATTLVAIQSYLDYRRRGVLDDGHTLKLTIPVLLGAGLGAFSVVSLSREVFARLVGFLLLASLAIVLHKPTPHAPEPPVENRGRLSIARRHQAVLGFLLFLGLGIYGGFFGGGIGMLMLPLISSLFGLDLVAANRVKTGLVALMNLSACAVFLYHDMVNFSAAAVVYGGMMIGSIVGVRTAVRKGERFLRPLLVGVTALASAYFLFWI